MIRPAASCFLLLLLLGSLPAVADSWDGYDELPAQALHDLAHGSDETHDLATRPQRVGMDEPDVDWSTIPQEPYSSYEVQIDGISSLAGNIALARLDVTGSLVRQSSVPLSAAGGWSRTLRWINDSSASTVDLARVQGADCELKCTQDARYRIRAMDTTVSIPRFNTSGSQTTVLTIKNLRSSSQAAKVYFWSAGGSLLGASTLSIAARGTSVLSVATLVAGSSGSITIAHDAGYGGLSAFSVILEPATGMSYLSEGTVKPR